MKRKGLLFIFPILVFGGTSVSKGQVLPSQKNSQKVIIKSKKTTSVIPEKSKADIASLSKLISSFSVQTTESGLKLEIQNVNGEIKSEVLNKKSEEYKEFDKYTFGNPFAINQAGDIQKIDLYIFKKIKPALIDDKSSADIEADISEMSIDLMILADSSNKKMIKSNADFYFKDYLIASGNLDSSSQIKLHDDLNKKVKDCKLIELIINKNLLDSNKRLMDFGIKLVHEGRVVEHNFTMSLLNMKLTPVAEASEEILDINEEVQDINEIPEGDKDEKNSNHT